MIFPLPINPQDPGRGPVIIGISWTFTIIAIIVVTLRICLRKVVNQVLNIEDWLMVLAVILQIVWQSCITTAYHYGLGKHDTDLYQPDEFVNALKWTWISTTPGLLGSMTARISIAILLIRIFGLHKWFRWFLIIFTTIQTVAGVVAVPVTWAQTTPASGLWDVYNPDIKRWNPDISKDLDIVTQSLWTCADLTYVLLPVIIIWNLNMPLRNRVGLMLLMSASLFTVAVSILKIHGVQSPPRNLADVEYNTSLGLIWNGMEQCSVIIMGCVPTLRNITKLKFPGLSSISTFVSSFVRRSKGMSSGSEGDRSIRPYSHGHIDLEMDTNGIAYLGPDRDARGFVAEAAYFPDADRGSQKGLIVEDGQVRRTDKVTVSFCPRKYMPG